MRLLRLRLANYRGIEEYEVEFSPKGLTIVEGPNEAGKTSLGESISLLFDYPASSNHCVVKAIKPVTRDVGSEIELEVESGPYHFTYFKRFHKKPETFLTVAKPKPENHTGREAHERAEEILRETIDVNLWNALCIQQGEAVQQADLSKQTSLSAALDSAAGGHRTDPREESLFDKVREEYERYYTQRGKEKKEFQETRKALEEAEAGVASLETQIQNLEKDIVRAAELVEELKHLKKQEQDLQDDVSEYTKALDEIKGLETALETASLKFESAKKSEQAAKRSLQDRQNLIEKISVDRKAYLRLEEFSSSSIESVQTAEIDLEKTQSDADEAEDWRKKAESLRNLYRADYDYFNDKLHLEQMGERKDRIDRAREEAAVADRLLETNRVDEATLKVIQMIKSLVVIAQAKLDMSAPNVLLRGLADFDYLIDGKPANISKGEEACFPVSDRINVTVPRSLQIEVTAGSSSSELLDEVEKAKRKLATAMSNAEVSSADEARLSYDARRKAEQTIERLREIEEENLRDLTYEVLERKVIELKKSVPAYPDARIQEPELPDDLESAQGELQDAEAAFEKTGKMWANARAQLELSRKVRDELRERHQEVKVQLDLKGDELNQAEVKLAGFRETVSDEDLEADHLKLKKLAEEEEISAKTAARLLQDLNPDQVKTLAETARGSLVTVTKELEDLKREHVEVRTRLKVHGEEGLHEKLNAAQTHLDHVKHENEAMIRRADAARLLFTIMKEERDSARRAYVVPLKEKIERLGRLVFNNTFEVEVDENLTVASRVLDGSQVPFTSLSGGTREQISLISRLACAMTVSENGGAPLILDDALGNTDPERLKLMGAVLSKAGQECQIIILTCVPERYCNVGEATVVRL